MSIFALVNIRGSNVKIRGYLQFEVSCRFFQNFIFVLIEKFFFLFGWIIFEFWPFDSQSIEIFVDLSSAFWIFLLQFTKINSLRPSVPPSSALPSELCPSGDSSAKPSVGGSKTYNFCVELTWALPYSFSDLSRDLTCNQTMWPLTWWSHDPRDM